MWKNGIKEEVEGDFWSSEETKETINRKNKVIGFKRQQQMLKNNMKNRRKKQEEGKKMVQEKKKRCTMNGQE